MLVLLVLAPLLAALAAFLVPSNRWRPLVLPAGGAVQLALVWEQIRQPAQSPAQQFDRWLVVDPLGKIFLGIVAVMFFLLACYAPAYLRLRQERDNRVLCTCLLLSLGMMTLILISHHLGLMWVAMEATTLCSAPGLYFNHNTRSLDATWKFLLICSVGIALALLGSLLLAYASLHANLEPTLLLDELLAEAPQLSAPWLRAAFILLLVGYGTKMGLAPMHTWKPAAYSAAPGMVGALLAGGMTNCAFLTILRFYQIVVAAGKVEQIRPLLIFMGLLSMLLAAAFMTRQKDFKRVLAFSSVEHMGILIFGIGIGGAGLFMALFHALNNGLAKGLLFLSAGNIHRAYGSKYVGDVSGACRRLPASGWLFLAGFLAITGSPPFSPFLSEFGIVSAAFAREHYVAAGLYLVALFLVFVAFGATVVGIVFGKPSAPPSLTRFRDHFATSWPIVVFLALVVTLGVYMPPQLKELLDGAVAMLENPLEWLKDVGWATRA